jgi:hypothetical protein
MMKPSFPGHDRSDVQYRTEFTIIGAPSSLSGEQESDNTVLENRSKSVWQKMDSGKSARFGAFSLPSSRMDNS